MKAAARSLILHVGDHVTNRDLEQVVRMVRARLGESSVVRATIRELKPKQPQNKKERSK